jgi:SAM-dependent methyltransferase
MKMDPRIPVGIQRVSTIDDSEAGPEPGPPRWADVVTASDDYRLRFRGAAGAWFLSVQEETLARLVVPWPKAEVLDVGGGHGQYTERLLAMGDRLTVLGSSAVADLQIRHLIDGKRCRFVAASIRHFPFADKSFDLVISTRMMAHREDWRDLLAEMTRVARHAVIVDFPARQSFNALYPVFFWLKRAAEGSTTRPYRLFGESEVREALGRNGFVPTARVAQYFLPMCLHRELRYPALSVRLERLARRLRLTALLGSPILLRAEPEAQSVRPK